MKLNPRDLLDHDNASFSAQLDAIIAVPDHRHESNDFQRACSAYAHACSARELWLRRIDPETPKPDEGAVDLFPESVYADELRPLLDRVVRYWDAYLAKVEAGPGWEAESERLVGYSSTEGRAWANSVGEILLHLFAHGQYHRGQIALLLGRLGVKSPATDYIIRARNARKPG